MQHEVIKIMSAKRTIYYQQHRPCGIMRRYHQIQGTHGAQMRAHVAIGQMLARLLTRFPLTTYHPISKFATVSSM